MLAVDTRSKLNCIPDAASRVLADADDGKAAMAELVTLMDEWCTARSPSTEVIISTDAVVSDMLIEPESRFPFIADSPSTLQ
jgi:hypothetical protein